MTTCVAVLRGEGYCTVVTGGADRAVRVWNGDSGVCTLALRRHRWPIVAVRIRLEPETTTILSLDRRGCAVVWDGQAGEIRHYLRPPHGRAALLSLGGPDTDGADKSPLSRL